MEIRITYHHHHRNHNQRHYVLFSQASDKLLMLLRISLIRDCCSLVVFQPNKTLDRRQARPISMASNWGSLLRNAQHGGERIFFRFQDLAGWLAMCQSGCLIKIIFGAIETSLHKQKPNHKPSAKFTLFECWKVAQSSWLALVNIATITMTARQTESRLRIGGLESFKHVIS